MSISPARMASQYPSPLERLPFRYFPVMVTILHLMDRVSSLLMNTIEALITFLE